MKIVKALMVVTVIAGIANAAPIDYVVSSALMPGDSVVYNLDFMDPFGLPFFDVTVESRVGNTGYSTTMNHIGTPPYYVNTYEGMEIYSNPTGGIEFYGRVEADTLLLTQSFKNTTNQFPPDPILYADLADDPIGDTLPGTMGQWLDLTGSGITYSDDRLFVRLNNAGGGWPTSQGFDFFAYAFALYNPGSSDLSATALAYASIPFVLTPGLYHVDLQDTSFTRIADIQYQIDGNSLHMSCAISDLLQDPNWNQWPPESEYILTGGLTLSVVSLEPSLNDFTYPSAFIPKTQYLDTNQNTIPVAGSFGIIPEYEISVEGLFEYNDDDNNLPVTALCIFDGDEYEMSSEDHAYDDGSTFHTLIDWPGLEWHTFFFRFSDGADIIETQLDSVYFSTDAIGDEDLPYAFGIDQNYPNPFNARTTIAFELGSRSDVNVAVYSITGEMVATLAEREYDAGSHFISWDGTDAYGNTVSSGIYFYKIEAGNYTQTRKMLLMK
jgi:hypothetical protein